MTCALLFASIDLLQISHAVRFSMFFAGVPVRLWLGCHVGKFIAAPVVSFLYAALSSALDVMVYLRSLSQPSIHLIISLIVFLLCSLSLVLETMPQ